MFLEKLNWRYATKKMDPARAVPEEKVARIVEAARLAPTSSGLQPFEVIVVTNRTFAKRSFRWPGIRRRLPKGRIMWCLPPG